MEILPIYGIGKVGFGPELRDVVQPPVVVALLNVCLTITPLRPQPLIHEKRICFLKINLGRQVDQQVVM